MGYLDEPNKNPRASIRWFLEGKHSNNSDDYGKKTNSKLFIMGINHVELNKDGIIREWVLFDEVAIWKQILMNKKKIMTKIKTTHVGSLPRSNELSELLFKKDKKDKIDLEF